MPIDTFTLQVSSFTHLYGGLRANRIVHGLHYNLCVWFILSGIYIYMLCRCYLYLYNSSYMYTHSFLQSLNLQCTCKLATVLRLGINTKQPSSHDFRV